MLEERWIPDETAEEVKLPSFDPRHPAYNDIPKRLSNSATMLLWNELKNKELDFTAQPDTTQESEKEERAATLEKLRTDLADAEAKLLELKSSIESDPTSLVNWMKTLFDLADAGLTSWDVGGVFWPHCSLHSLFGGLDAASLHDGIEKLLGTFKKRYELERGANQIQIFTKFAPNIFNESYTVLHVEKAVDRMRENLQVDSIDMVQVVWWDFQGLDPIPTLLALNELTKDKVEIDPDLGVDVVTVPKRVTAIGLVDFPAKAIVAAIHAGVSITAVVLSYSILTGSEPEELTVCKDYGIKVIARGGCLGGLISEDFLNASPPNNQFRDSIVEVGGWAKFQKVLSLLKTIGDKHLVTIQTVALRWQMDHGVFPLLDMGWKPFHWKPFGYLPKYGTDPGVDHQLFYKASFLDEEDMRALARIVRS